MEKSESIKNITIALLNFQKLVGKIPKDSKNPFFKSAYASLPDILDKVHQPLIDSGLIITQWPSGTNGLTTLISHESGEFMQETYQMTPVKNDPQSLGSSITYQRRYALGAVLNLNIDVDDDGNNASGLNDKQTKQNPPVPIDYKKSLTDCKTLDNLKDAFIALPKEQKELLTDYKDEMKEILTQVEAIGKIKTLLALNAYILEFDKSTLKDNAKLKALLNKRQLELKG